MRTRTAQEPASGATIGLVGLASEDDVKASCQAAKRAAYDWGRIAAWDRGEILRKAADHAEQHLEEIAEWLVRESGSVPAKAEFEVRLSIKALRVASAMSSQAEGDVLPSTTNRLSIARRRPIGVVGIIAPFNFPLYLAMRAVAPALAVGNAVVLKPDPRTAICGGFVIARIFEDAGLPQGVLHVLPGDGDAGAQLCRDSNIGLVQFTGSTRAGRKVGALAGEHLKKVSLELGGKNALIVCHDADLDIAASNAAWGGFLHQGQICMASSRILVHESVASAFTAKLAARAKALPAGDPMMSGMPLGPMIGAEQVDYARAVIDTSLSKGARLVVGGNPDGLFFPPTVLADVAEDSPAYTEELFAPVIAVTTFSTYEQAIAMANDSEFGLSVGVITNDIHRALTLTEELDFGICHINDQTVGDDVINPFGGMGASGNGTSIGGPANWELFTHWQWVTLKGVPPTYPF
ncbi:benzaldehyde dehydrogenase [Pseudomonas luteola]|uniref:benzaldehyde dehydrogenase n=1 Tax=Pseudomonas luteola TaxID=47886 RepID=UPI0012390798|nr:benzaldehyde dehydrogenase [Pseudomonas luteola]QEU26314.1 aldehyde dehydrogenase family protein [Pseudomonas luteola]